MLLPISSLANPISAYFDEQGNTIFKNYCLFANAGYLIPKKMLKDSHRVNIEFKIKGAQILQMLCLEGAEAVFEVGGQDVAHAQADAAHLVGVSGADALEGGADLGLAL